MYQLQEALFDKLDSFNIIDSDEQKFLKNKAKFDFEWSCVQEDKFRERDTTTWIDKHFPIFVSISSNLIKQSIVFCKSNPAALLESFVDVLDGLATEGKAQMSLKILEIELSVKSKLNQISSTPN